MPDGGKGWHHAFQTGREERLEREKGGGGGGAVHSASLVQKEEVPSCWQESRLNL